MQTDVVLGNMLSPSSRKNWCTSLHLLQFLFHSSIEPDAITCSSLAAAYGYLHRWQPSLMTVVQMGYLTSSSQVDLACLGATLDACVKSFTWEIATILTSNIGSLSRSEAAYLAAMEGPSKASQWMLSVQQLQELNWNTLQPNVLMYSALGSGRLLSFLIIFFCTGGVFQQVSAHGYDMI